MDIRIFQDNEAVAKAFAAYFAAWLEDKQEVSVALSGGSTPKVLFQHWAESYQEKIPWEKIHFFWGDERCVPPDHEESNFGMTKALLFDQINIPEKNIHRVRGEEEPGNEAIRYAQEITKSTKSENDLPVFDLIILGMGADGHTASIFPHQMELLRDSRITAVAKHPKSGQKRISITGKVINNAKLIIFLVTGASKKPVLDEITNKSGNWEAYPASHIKPEQGKLIWIVDESAISG